MKHRFSNWYARKALRSYYILFGNVKMYYFLFGNMKMKNLNPYWAERWRAYNENDIVCPEKVDNRIFQASRMYLWSKPCCKWLQARKRRQDRIREQRRKEYEHEAENFYQERQGQV